MEQSGRTDQKEDRGVIHWQQGKDWQRKGRVWEGLRQNLKEEKGQKE